MSDYQPDAAHTAKGHVWQFENVTAVVRRVARDGSWADLHCSQPNGSYWSKRQPLPFPDGFVFVGVQFGGSR